jgi:hypothetical protein
VVKFKVTGMMGKFPVVLVGGRWTFAEVSGERDEFTWPEAEAKLARLAEIGTAAVRLRAVSL